MIRDHTLSTVRLVFMCMTYINVNLRKLSLPYIFESAFSKFPANNFEFLLTFKNCFDWCKCHVTNRIKHHEDKDESQTERIMSFKHGSRKRAWDKKFLIEPYNFYSSYRK